MPVRTRPQNRNRTRTQNAAYLVIINLSGRALELPTDGDEKAWPWYIDLEGDPTYTLDCDEPFKPRNPSPPSRVFGPSARSWKKNPPRTSTTSDIFPPGLRSCMKRGCRPLVPPAAEMRIRSGQQPSTRPPRAPYPPRLKSSGFGIRHCPI